MKRTILAAAVCLSSVSASTGAQAPVKQEPGLPSSGLTINDCLLILQGLNSLDGRQVVVNAGKSNEQVVLQAYEFGNAKLRLDIAHDLAILSAVQKDSQAVQQKIFLEVGKGSPDIKPGTPELLDYNNQLKDLMARPCLADVSRIKAGDLKLDKNDIPGSVLAAIDKILDR
jgi:hypothetical protein